jgi:hypothetical protein
MRKSVTWFLTFQLLVVCILNLHLSNAMPGPKNSQWTPGSNTKSRDSRSSKEKEKGIKSDCYLSHSTLTVTEQWEVDLTPKMNSHSMSNCNLRSSIYRCSVPSVFMRFDWSYKWCWQKRQYHFPVLQDARIHDAKTFNSLHYLEYLCSHYCHLSSSFRSLPSYLTLQCQAYSLFKSRQFDMFFSSLLTQ